MKKCRECGKVGVVSRREDHLYVECGLPNVVVRDMEVRVCVECGTKSLVIERATELTRTIAMAIVGKHSRLTGAEVRYLRKSLGWSGVDFARHMSVTPETVSRWENGHDLISGTADRLLRLMVVVYEKRAEDYSLETLTEISDTQENMALNVRQDAGEWRAVA